MKILTLNLTGISHFFQMLSLYMLNSEREEKKNIYLHFIWFIHIDMTEAIEIIPHVRQELTYQT